MEVISREKNIKLNNEASGGGSSIEIEPDNITVTSRDGQTVSIGKNTIKIDCGGGTTIEVKPDKIELTATSTVVLNGPAGIQLKTPKLDVG